jgi:flagellar assembly protein FliH
MSLSRSVIKAPKVRVDRMVTLTSRPEGLEPLAPPALPQLAPLPAAIPTMPPAEPQPLDMNRAQQSLLTEAVAQSQEILEKARGQAAELLKAARDQAAEITRQAHQAGLTAAEAESSRLLLAARGVLDEVQTWRDRLSAGSERQVLELVVDVARSLFGEGWTLEAEALHAAFARALAEARPLGDLRVHVHPDDAALLGPRWPEQQSSQIGQHLELVPDPVIRRGGCLVEGDFGAVDARVETQLQLAVEALTAPDQRE